MENTITHEGVEYRKVVRKAEVGELITYSYNGEHSGYPREVTEVTSKSAYFEAYLDDDDEDNEETIGYAHDAYLVLEPIEAEPTPVEASPTVIELLANISRRLYEAEKEIAELNEKQAVFFDIDKLLIKRIVELERQNREQTYEINELYKAVADRG